MPARLRSSLTYANVMATIAVFVALGGSSYAAIKVTGKNVKDSSLTGKDIKNSSLAGGDIKDSSLGQRDFKRGELPAGPRGATGLQGPKGDPGVAGAPATKLFANVTSGGTLGAARQGATAATRNATGDYTITFNRPLAGCVAFAQAGFVEGTGDVVELDAFMWTSTNGATVRVRIMKSESLLEADSTFNVVVFC